MKRNDLAGQQFNRLTVLDVHGVCKKKNVLWRCQCECGGTAIAYAYDLRSGRVKSCGCLVKEGLHVVHGRARAGIKRDPLYSVWAAMMQRCYNPKDRNYKNYGGRGIQVHERWHNFLNFYADVRPRPSGLSLDRIDNNRGYAPDNFRWATPAQQSLNRRAVVLVTVSGETLPVTHALRKLEKTGGVLHYWMKKLNTDHQGVIDVWLQQKKRL